MALTSSYEYIHYVECDGCRSRAPFGFHRFVAIFKARHAGYQRHETKDKDKPYAWLCSKCRGECEACEALPTPVEKAPLQVVSTRS